MASSTPVGLAAPYIETPPIQPFPLTDMSTPQGHQQLWDNIMSRRAAMQAARLAPPLIRLFDGDMELRGEVAGWRDVDYEFIENDTGTCTLQLSLDHYLAKWIMNFQGRAKRNVIITIDKQGSRWSGTMDHYTVTNTIGNDRYLSVVFKHDFEQVKHILCWCNPFLISEVQFPKLWVIFGPAKWCLLVTLFVNILRLETSLWTLPDNPLDPSEWMPLSFDPSNWRNITKPFTLLSDNSDDALVFSRFQTWFDVAKPILASSQLTVNCRRYLKDEDPHPFSDLAPELGVLAEDLFSLIPLRNGCLVWDIVDNSGWRTGTSFGGSLLTGLVRAVVDIASDGLNEGINVFTGDPTYPGEYYTPGFTGTRPEAPWVVFDASSPYTGVSASEFTYNEATDTSFLTGGHSMPGVNEAISAGINLGGDFLTSLINSLIAEVGAVDVGAAFGGSVDFSIPSIDLPPLGGLMDAVAKIFYEDTFMAFMEIPTLRALGAPLPIAGLEKGSSGLGDFHYYEGWGTGADRAFTLSALMAILGKNWETRAHTTHKIQVSDAAPYLVGEPGYGHFWLGNRVGTTVPGWPIPDTIFVERVGKLRYGWGKDGSRGWQLTVGYEEPQEPALKALDEIRKWNSALSTLGIL